MRRTLQAALVILTGSMLFACGGSGSQDSNSAPAPSGDDWSVDVINNSGVPLEVFPVDNGGNRGRRLGIVDPRQMKTWNVPYQGMGLQFLLVDVTEDRRFTSQAVRAAPGTGLVLTIGPDFDTQITARN